MSDIYYLYKNGDVIFDVELPKGAYNVRLYVIDWNGEILAVGSEDKKKKNRYILNGQNLTDENICLVVEWTDGKEKYKATISGLKVIDKWRTGVKKVYQLKLNGEVRQCQENPIMIGRNMNVSDMEQGKVYFDIEKKEIFVIDETGKLITFKSEGKKDEKK